MSGATKYLQIIGGLPSADLEERLAAVEGDIADIKNPFAINSFSHDAGTRENGDKVTSVKLSWNLSRVPKTLTVGGDTVESAKTGSTTVTGNFTSETTWTLRATDDRDTVVTKNTTLYFYDGIYYGCVTKPTTVNSAFIMSLPTKKLSGTKNLSNLSVTGGAEKYFYYAYPASMGKSKFTIGGFDYDYEYSTVSFTNKFGVTKNYYVYVSGQPILNTISVTVKGG